MQLLLHGWLAVSWGRSPWFLAVFAASRLGPKVALTLPAGIICDRVRRTRILLGSRWLGVLASLLPLAGFAAPWPVAWVLAASALAGVAHAFDLPAGRAVLADLTPKDDLDAAVALNSAGFHVSALVGPPLASVLVAGPGRPAALMASAAVLVLAAIAAGTLPAVRPRRRPAPAASDATGLVRYLASAPAVILLLLAGSAPSVVDKAVALLLPSMTAGSGTVSVALLAPELGALLAATLLAVAPVRLGTKALVAAAVTYAVLIGVASRSAQEAETLVAALGFAGMAKLAINATALARVQHVVPAELRGRVLAV